MIETYGAYPGWLTAGWLIIFLTVLSNLGKEEYSPWGFCISVFGSMVCSGFTLMWMRQPLWVTLIPVLVVGIWMYCCILVEVKRMRVEIRLAEQKEKHHPDAL